MMYVSKYVAIHISKHQKAKKHKVTIHNIVINDRNFKLKN